MVGLTLEQMEFLASKGLSFEDAIEFAKLGKKRSAGAERQARYRARKNGRDVTSDVTRDASLPPIEELHTPLVSSDEETAPRHKSKVLKPEGVSDQTWTDFTAHRKRQRADLTATALAGIQREAEKAGWTLEAALAELVARGWRSFKAEWVAEKQTGPPAAADPLVDRILARQAPAH